MGAKFDAKAIEQDTRKRLDANHIRSMLEESSRPRVSFVEGPPTLNGSPHAGHLRGRVIKDLWYRFTTLRGACVAFQGGWDTQGLPVELQAEKTLGVTGGKAEIARRGVEELVDTCKSIVKKYNTEWERADDLLGVWMDHGKSYWTYHDSYIEREWQILKKARQEGILEDDYTVIGYCPGCQTSLSHAEVNQGYDIIKDPSLYYKVRLADEDTYLVVWTTMPFTLVTDAMVGLHPEETYAIVRVEGEKWVVAERRLEQFMQEVHIDEYEVLQKVKGSYFESRKYVHPLLDAIPGLQEKAAGNYHVAVAESFVDATAGSGLVHLAPANGEEDIAIAKRRGIDIFCPIDDEVRFTADAGRYAGMFVRDADNIIVEDLEKRGALVRIGSIRHKYPRCWRSRHPIVWLARRGWFYKLDRLGRRAIEAAGQVGYFFDAPRNRFLAIVGERHPWCISRERYWGCPLPVWDCKQCGHKTWCYSRQEICQRAAALPDGEDFELHRPWIDRISIRCEQCGSADTTREQYVLDTWHNSGAAPFASQDDTGYYSGIPAPFFTEGIDQTRGWAYTLLIENVILGGKPQAPYRSFLFQGHVLDEKGGKMSKSLGNVIDAQQLLERHPADLVRLYFMWKASPVEPLNFSVEEMVSRPYQILSTLYNLHLYYIQNSGYDSHRQDMDIQWARDMLEPQDKWLLSKLQGAIKKVSGKIERCKFHEAARILDDFIINILSQSYVQGVREDMVAEEQERRRHVIYAVLHEALLRLDIMMHPFCPFTSEYLYSMLGGRQPSVLLEKWPESDDSLVDYSMEGMFDTMHAVLSVAAAARARGRLKRRWPLEQAAVVVPQGGAITPDMAESLRVRMNVDRLDMPVEAATTEGLAGILELRRLGMPIVPTVSLNLQRLGPRLRQDMAGLRGAMEDTNPEDILDSGGAYTFCVGGQYITLQEEDFVFGYEPEEGFAAASRDGYAVFVSIMRDDARGMLKDVARRLQSLRKERGYNPTSILESAHVRGLDARCIEMIKSGGFDLASAVRVRNILLDQTREYTDVDIDGHIIGIDISG